MGVFRRVEASASFSDDGVKPWKRPVRQALGVGKVQRQGDPGCREGEETGGRGIPAAFENGQGRAATAGCDGLQDFAQGVVGLRLRQQALELLEAAAPVDAVPLEDGVQREEIRLVVDARCLFPAVPAPVEQGVEPANAPPIDQRDRRVNRESALANGRQGEVPVFGVIADPIKPTAKRVSRGCCRSSLRSTRSLIR